MSNVKVELNLDSGSEIDPYVFDAQDPATQRLLKAGVPESRLREISDAYAAAAAEDQPADKVVKVVKRG